MPAVSSMQAAFSDGEWLFWRDLSSDEIEQKLNSGYDIAFLPIGSTEVHGRHCPVSTDTLIAEATCLLMARKHKGLVLPTVEYSWPGQTASQPGTIGIRPEVLATMVRAILEDLFSRGFDKVVVYSVHGPNNWILTPLIRSYFEETGHAALLLTNLTTPDVSAELRKIWAGLSPGYSEASRALAARKILGRPGPVDFSHIEPDMPVEWPEARSAVQQFGAIGWYYTQKEQHIPLTPDISWEKGYQYLTEAVARQGDLRKALIDYIAYAKDRWKRPDDTPLGYKGVPGGIS